MSNSCNEKNPLTLLGTSQYQRLLDALKPAYAKLYSRSEADWILFTRNLSSYIQYYNFQNNKEGNWQAFMSADPSVNAAVLSRLKEKDCASYQLGILNNIKSLNSLPGLKEQFKYLFDHAFSLLYIINREYEALNEELELSAKLKSTIQSQLAKLYQQLKTYYQEVSTSSPVLLDATVTVTDTAAPIEIYDSNFCIDRLDKLSLWNYSGTLPDITMDGSGAKERIKNYSSHNIFTGCLNAIIKNSINIGIFSENQLQYLINSYSEHNPHYALYLAFIKLISYTGESLNTFSQRHLDFYYKTILQIAGKNAEPDSAFLVVETAKNTNSYLIEKGTPFKGGKDAAGNELFYTADVDTVISKASVARLQNIYVKKDFVLDTPAEGVFSGTVANSADGAGAELVSADKSWSTFGTDQSPLAEYGFAIGSNLFFTRGGTRYFTILIEVDDPTPVVATFTGSVSKIKFSGKKGWIEIDSSEIYSFAYDDEQYLYIIVKVDASFDPIVPYDATIHGSGFDITDPLCVIYFNNEKGTGNIYESLSKVKFSNLIVNCNVSGYKNFTLHNGITTVDIAKPFDLLGPSPSVGSSFIIGSNEIFYKNQQNNLSVGVYLEWDKYEKLSGQFVSNQQQLNFSYLENGSFQTNTDANTSFFPLNLVKWQMYYPMQDYSYVLDKVNYQDDLPFTIDSVDGYVKFQLDSKEFGHSYYSRQLAEFAKNGTYHTSYPNGSVTATGSPPPPEPYTPAVNNISISYDVTHTNNDGSGTIKNLFSFFHVGPLGNQRFDITQEDTSNLKEFNLVPQFDANGELLIGFEKANANETVSVLFKLSEGSADPFQDRTTIEWSYLNNEGLWINYEKSEVTDGTLDLTQSGIIKFSLPADISNQNLMYASGLHWIKGKTANTGSVCNAISVRAQGIKVTLSDYKNTGVEFTKLLDASVISKLQIAVPEIKKVEQPYPSFNGKIAEKEEQYYNRVSERLRHKNRAITMWDYERIVLEEFTELYKVKCINHHKCDDTNNYEMVPGHVTVVPVMNLQGNNFVNPLRPYTPIGTLTNIKQHLLKIISPFIELHVVNPVFEEVQLDFKVVFNSDDTSYYHEQLINDIEAYLTPWAFDNSAGIEFGGSVKKSVLIDFIDELSYVDHISCVKMYHWINGIKTPGDKEEIVATSARSVLVSFSGNDTEPKHNIDFITENCTCG